MNRVTKTSMNINYNLANDLKEWYIVSTSKIKISGREECTCKVIFDAFPCKSPNRMEDFTEDFFYVENF